MTTIIGFDPPLARLPGHQAPPPARAYRLDAAGEKTVLLPEASSREPFEIPGIQGWSEAEGYHPVTAVPGEIRDDWSMVKSIIRAHAFRICPWAILWCAPGYHGSAYWGGRAWGKEGIGLVCVGEPTYTLETAFHETWHLLEEWIDPATLARLDAALAQGPAYGLEPETWIEKPRPYYGLAWERRARAFAHLAMLHIEGACPPGADWPGDSAWSILARAWSGELGREAAERREAAYRAERRRIAATTVRTVNFDKKGRMIDGKAA